MFIVTKDDETTTPPPPDTITEANVVSPYPSGVSTANSERFNFDSTTFYKFY
jgi:hypothetical protein